MDILKLIDIEVEDKTPFVVIKKSSVEKIEKILEEYHIGKDVPLIGINPGANPDDKRRILARSPAGHAFSYFFAMLFDC